MPSPRRIAIRVRRHFAPHVLGAALALFVLWTWLALGTSLLQPLDDLSRTHYLAAGSGAAQIWSAIAVVTLPGVLATVLVIVAGWAWRRRLRNLTAALVLSVLFSWGGNFLLKHLFTRPRPSSPLADVITHSGWSYPSGHMTMATTAALMVIATTTTTRQPSDVRYLARVLGGLGVALVACDRFVMNAHWPTDIVAGFLMGLVCASLASIVARVHMLPIPRRRIDQPQPRTCAIVWNPSKVIDRASFRRTVEYELEHGGWEDPLWLQTRPDDPGYSMTRTAIERGVDLVLVAGGDGTVRIVCSELAGSGIPLGIIPAGTGNLLARNLDIPLDEVAAARVAFGGIAKPIDLVKVTIDGDDSTAEHFAVMAGIGIDARIMENTRPELKKTVGSAAYFLAAAQEINAEPMDLTFQVDGQPPERRRAMMAVVGNVGILQGGLQLIPRASATDGLLDLSIASPRNHIDWAAMATRVMALRSERVNRVDQIQAQRVRISVAEEMPYELDGDTAGRATVFEAEVVPQALLLMQP
ncbi:MAG: phosphatase PAP2 family protein [Luteococcus sp.]|uniref:diacylglycerol kinase family protein n=1 Tax=Luteococcus sp. TaxID=1969402 RepID=UPI0026480903|nr:diacylglycerol kinase family protein [Luteococcus sp.]MDN5563532.1 phosphatase PAP2 family protein [Luteococcus sp.]